MLQNNLLDQVNMVAASAKKNWPNGGKSHTWSASTESDPRQFVQERFAEPSSVASPSNTHELTPKETFPQG